MFDHISNLDSRCATVVFLLNGGQFYLAQKKDDIHQTKGDNLSGSARKWNGYGGKWQEGDQSIYHTAARELKEESSVRVKEKNLHLVARIEFFWPGNMTYVRDMEVFFFTASEYFGVPSESETMGPPKFFSVHNAPYKQMMPADELIIRNIMNRKIVGGRIYFTKINGEIVIREPILSIKEM